MNNNNDLSISLWKFLKKHAPRVLGQIDRDPDSPTVGSCDRNFWHYKIRDFSSIILQQAHIIEDSLLRLSMPDNPWYQSHLLENSISSGIDFWAESQLSSGSFNEYYPFEEGFPPTAFSLYATGIILRNREYQGVSNQVKNCIQKAVDYLFAVQENEASNQEAAGLAGIALASKVPGIKVDTKQLQIRIDSLLSKQDAEGWFFEYGGPDVGYLSVTLDCLVDIYDIFPAQNIILAIDNAVKFISFLVCHSNQTPPMINARNTDYIVPYGLVKTAQRNPMAAAVVRKLFAEVDDYNHFLNRIDDRYACHYVFQSCFRAISLLPEMTTEKSLLPYEQNDSIWLNSSGIYIDHTEGISTVVSPRKGGIVYRYDNEGMKSCDFGWRLKNGKEVIVNHWQDSTYTISAKNEGNKVEIVSRGVMSKHSYSVSSPEKHFVLRMASKITGRRLIPILKKIMIFNNKKSDVSFCRKILLDAGSCKIEDQIAAPNLQEYTLHRAPSFSLRHVASAGGYLPEDMATQPHAQLDIENNTAVSIRVLS